MKRILGSLGLLLCLALALTGCTVNAEARIGEADGYGGRLRVEVLMDGAQIRSIRVAEHHETEGVGTKAIDALPDAMVRANTAEVDSVTGATVTSNALKTAVREALAPAVAAQPAREDAERRSGLGMTVTGRVGPGTAADGSQVYSLNIVFADAVFDAAGYIQHLDVDQLELLSPNTDAAGASVFTGWPGQGAVTEELFMRELPTWITKRRRGSTYMLNSGSWAQQMDAYERLFTGMTVDEVEQWYDTHCSPATGRPLRQDAQGDELTMYQALPEEERAALADVTSSATMSLRGSYGDIITAIRRAWEAAN